MRQRALPKPTPKGCPECGAQETRGTVLHRPTCSRKPTVSDGRPHPLIGPDDPLTLIGREVLRRRHASQSPLYPDAAPAIVRAAIGGDAAGPPYTHRITGDYCPYCGGHPELNADHREAIGLVGLTPDEMDAASLGRKGGQSRASHLSPAERRESARKAAKARWGKADA